MHQLTDAERMRRRRRRRVTAFVTFPAVLIATAGVGSAAGMGWLAGLTILSFGSISMIITPGGLGSYPPIIAAILLLYGISEPGGLAFGWVAWSVQTAVIILFGIISLFLLPLLNRTPRHAKAPVDPA